MNLHVSDGGEALKYRMVERTDSRQQPGESAAPLGSWRAKKKNKTYPADSPRTSGILSEGHKQVWVLRTCRADEGEEHVGVGWGGRVSM